MPRWLVTLLLTLLLLLAGCVPHRGRVGEGRFHAPPAPEQLWPVEAPRRMLT